MLRILLFVVFISAQIPAVFAATLHDKQYLQFSAYTVDDGLPQSQAKAITQDDLGFLWLGTEVGVSRFDGYHFKNYLSTENLHQSTEEILTLLNDSKGRLWAGSKSGALYLYNRVIDDFELVEFDKNVGAINDIAEDQNGDLLLATDTGLFLLENASVGRSSRLLPILFDTFNLHSAQSVVVVKSTVWIVGNQNLILRADLDNSLEESHRVYLDSQESQIPFEKVRKIYLDPFGDIWGVLGKQGLIKFNTASKSWQSIQLLENKYSAEYVHDVLVDPSGDVWIGTEGHGLIYIEKNGQFTTNFTDKFPGIGSITGDSIYRLYIDYTNNLWLSETGGLNKAHMGEKKFISVNGGMAYNVPNFGRYVGEIWEQNEDILWFESEQGLARWDLKSNGLQFITEDSGLSNNIIMDLLLADERYLVINNSDVDLLDTQTSEIRRLSAQLPPEFKDEFATDNRLFLDANSNLLVGTASSRVFRFNQQFELVQTLDLSHLKENAKISGMYAGKDQSVWIVLDRYGLVQFDLDYQLIDDLEVEQALAPKFNVLDFYIDEQQQKWIGTRSHGLAMIDKTKQWRWFNKSTGFVDDRIYAIEGDKMQHVWVSTNRGLVEMNMMDYSFQNYTSKDGLVGSEFNSRASHLGNSGRLYFGGINGITWFYPGSSLGQSYQPNLVFTAAKLRTAEQETKLMIRDNNVEPLSYKDKVIVFEFSSLDFSRPASNQYAYRINNDDWINIGTDNHIIFTDLSPNSYLLEVKRINEEGLALGKSGEIFFEIPSPPWLTHWAYAIYSLFVISLFFYVYKTQRDRYIHQRLMTINERKVSKELRRLNRLKDQILTNTSHETRTPLNGIIGLNHTLSDPDVNLSAEERAEYHRLINVSADQLLQLVNDMIDVAELHNKSMSLNWEDVDLRKMVKDIFIILRPLLGDKKIDLDFNISESDAKVKGDANRLRQVMFNLISNAIKFTNAGNVLVSTTSNNNKIVISVKDTGIGIAPKNHKRIFSSFSQVDSSATRAYGGAGLGLTISKEILELHGSVLNLRSKLGEGAEFYFELSRA